MRRIAYLIQFSIPALLSPMTNKKVDEDEIFPFALLVIKMFLVLHKPNYTAGTVLCKCLYYNYMFHFYLIF